MNEKKIKAASFVGGLVFFSIVVGVVLVKNERIRAEVEEQASILLKTTKSAISQIQFVVSKIGKITGEGKSAISNSNNDNTPVISQGDKYDAQWSSL